MNVKPAGRVLRKPACTWLNVIDYEQLKAIAQAEGVTIAAYMRSMIVDVLADEADRRTLSAERLRLSPTASCQAERI